MVLFSSNALLVKTRALYSKRLKSNDLENLLACKNVSQVAEYLKKTKSYSNIFFDIKSENIFRGTLESVLRKSIFNNLEVLVKYDVASGKHFFDYIISKTEIVNILRFLIFLKGGNAKNYETWFPDFFLKYTKIDFEKMQNSLNYSDFLNSISKSLYYKIIKDLNYSQLSEIDLNVMETRFYSYFFDNILKISKINLNNDTFLEIEKFYKNYVDVINIVKILRLKKNYNKSDDFIYSLLFKFKKYNLTKIKKIIKLETTDKILEMIKEKYGNIAGEKKIKFDQIPGYVKFKWAKHKIFFSTDASVVLLSYVLLKEIEIINIINITEGKRYGLDVEEIKKMLVS